MRRVLKFLLLVALVVVALWFLNDRGDQPSDPSASGGTLPSAPASAAPRDSSMPVASSRPSSEPSPTPSNQPSTAAEDPPSSTVDAGEVEGAVVDPAAVAVPRDDAQRARLARYEQAAVDFLTAFARPRSDVSREQWWASVRPHLSDGAAAAYEGTDPAAVPFTAVTGPAVILPTDGPTHLLMLARVPTDAGYYRVEMTTNPTGIRISRITTEGGDR